LFAHNQSAQQTLARECKRWMGGLVGAGDSYDDACERDIPSSRVRSFGAAPDPQFAHPDPGLRFPLRTRLRGASSVPGAPAPNFCVLLFTRPTLEYHPVRESALPSIERSPS